MSHRSFLTAFVGLSLALAACGGGSSGSTGAGASGNGGSSGTDCNAACAAVATMCGQPTSYCGAFCATSPSAAEIACLQGAGCDMTAWGQCLQAGASTSTASSSSGSACKASGSQCTSNSECCSGLSCNNGSCVTCSLGKNGDPCSVSSDCCSNLCGSSGNGGSANFVCVP